MFFIGFGQIRTRRKARTANNGYGIWLCESVNENIYLATAFGYGGQKRFQNRHRHSRALAAITGFDMKLIPFERFRIETRLTKDQVKERLKKRIGKNRVKNFERLDPKYFFGTLTGDKFEIHPILENKRNSWKPFLFGTINETRTGTSVTVTMRPHLVVLLITLTLAVYGFFQSDTVLTIESKDLEIGLSFVPPLIFYVLCTAFFHSDTETCKDYLIEITEGELK